MCGFIGAVSAGGPKPDLGRGLPFLSRRGPDSQRVWTSSDSRVILQHARLGIVDFDGRADQPMSDPSAGVTIAFVGEIYNYPEIRQSLPNYSYRTESDTEVILAAYLAHGTEAFRLMRGMFIAALVDERRRRVVLVRDPIGKKPLFIGRVKGATWFGCTLTAMLASAGATPEINPDALSDYAHEGWVHPSRCLVKDFRPLSPGEVVELNWEGQELGRTDCRPLATRYPVPRSFDEAAKEIGRRLRLAIERRVEHSPVPTVLLSGGIDSTVVTAGLQEVCRKRGLPLQVLALGSLLPWRNDEPYAREAARRLQIRLEILRIPLRRLGNRVLEALDAQDEPLGMIAYFTLFELVRTAKSHGRILLTGDGGDEVFLGYGKPRDWIRSDDGSSTPDPGLSCGPPLPDWMSPWGRRTVTAQLVGHMFAKADRASAEQGVEIRCPLLDWDVMAYSRGLPHQILLAGDKMKALLKAQLEGWPERFLERPKVGFAFNMRYLWALSGYAGLRESIEPDAVAAVGETIPPAFRRRASSWSGSDIFRNFDMAWRLLALSRFLARMRQVA